MDNKEIAIKFGAWIAKQTEIFDGKHFAFKKKIESTNGNVHNDDLMNVETLFEIFLSWEEITISNEQSEIERLKVLLEGIQVNAKAWVEVYRKEANEAIQHAKEWGEQIKQLEIKLDIARSLSTLQKEHIKQLESKLADRLQEIVNLNVMVKQMENKLVDAWDEGSDIQEIYREDGVKYKPENPYRSGKLAEHSEGQDAEIEKIILDWLKSGNENITYLVHLLKSKLTRI